MQRKRKQHTKQQQRKRKHRQSKRQTNKKHSFKKRKGGNGSEMDITPTPTTISSSSSSPFTIDDVVQYQYNELETQFYNRFERNYFDTITSSAITKNLLAFGKLSPSDSYVHELNRLYPIP